MCIILYYKLKHEVMPSSFEAQAHTNPTILSTTPSHKGIPPW